MQTVLMLSVNVSGGWRGEAHVRELLQLRACSVRQLGVGAEGGWLLHGEFNFPGTSVFKQLTLFSYHNFEFSSLFFNILRC
jgi:hypothetical protein